MGTLEDRAQKSRRRRNMQNAVLAIVQTAGALAIVAVAPNVLLALPALMGKERYSAAFQARNAVGRLLAKRFIKKNARGFLEITEAGARHLALQQARSEKPASAKRRWDGRYRLVMFDIPQRRRGVRDRLRSLMREFGFLRIQDSVWLSPYDCEDLVALVKAELRVGRDVLYAVVDQIDNDAWVREHFSLS